MVRLLGDKVLPEAVQSRRRSVRMRLEDLREPVRQRRERHVPGPDLIGNLESSISSVRQSFVARETLISRIQSRRNSGDDAEVQENPADKNTPNSSQKRSSSNRRTIT